jgi:hypothetical protein
MIAQCIIIHALNCLVKVNCAFRASFFLCAAETRRKYSEEPMEVAWSWVIGHLWWHYGPDEQREYQREEDEVAEARRGAGMVLASVAAEARRLERADAAGQGGRSPPHARQPRLQHRTKHPECLNYSNAHKKEC